ncbi:bifunctional GNAT family N-acetyltransferase/hotdog fold thioesterase [Litorilituus sediminis]|uniref:GNAT family N-acetyltransferase n=1 Tax=Litorilituus sediminis TaxID=718192 RepID=A0A4P6P3H7_9GAMM|nr:bifunctional GNAT family N-acetyltransferase/hotdog fold thioesterase [Litorilituus sediminis]QBG35804.1 GNAT family N-acetyltransferase [Litorilituus sediminis]
MYPCRSPKNAEEFDKYYQLRWQVLRKPWQQAKGSEQDELEGQSFHRMITDSHGEALAVGRLERTGQFTGQIRYMAVSPEAQGKGLGKQVLTALEQLAIRLGIKELVFNAREAALPFYLGLGYSEQGYSHTLFDEIKHLKMTKSLVAQVNDDTELVTQLEQTWHDTIPVSKAMNIQISHYDRAKLITHCDPEFNKNLHNTMFAGSIYTLATLTGWGWVYLQLAQEKLTGDIVLANADIRYHAPIHGIANAEVDFEEVSGDLQTLAEGKKAKMALTARLFCGDKVAATFNGTFYVLPKSK